MSTIFDYVPHPHLEKRRAEGPPKVVAAVAQVHGPGRIGQLNAKVGLRITVIVGTMWCAYLFTLLALVSVKSAFSTGNIVTIVAWIAQTFLQLVLLPIIIVGQNVQAAAADARSQATYDDAVAILEEARQIQEHLAAQDEHLERILASLAR
jgi:UDP-N-acetylglucosamine:LPS N-acetylglucosamine transferase